ncbi:MAG TPA: CRTAC1 family protein [Pirellulales bacterium]|nr:CRTAC1 family protein [Pirellulales bacterium]
MFDATGCRWLISSIALGLLLGGCNRSEPPPAPPDEEPAAAAVETTAQSHADETPPPAPREARPDDWFEDMTERSGVRFAYRNGAEARQYTILETVGGGVAMIDYDNDDDLDLFFPGGGCIASAPLEISGMSGKLYRNDGDWKFVDVTAEAGLAEAAGYTHGCAAADFDRDGFTDLFVSGYRCSRLYRNDGRGRFQDVTEKSGLSLEGWSTAAAWADLDRDGWPELFVANYLDWRPADNKPCSEPDSRVRDVCAPQSYPGVSDQLFRNRQGAGFEEITDAAGIRRADKGLGVLAADVNEDGWIDFYIANDVIANRLYLGRGDLRFEEQATLSGTAASEFGAPEGSMGVDFGDYNGDGRGDLWVVNFEMEDNSLYRNDGNDSFTHASVLAGLGGRCRALVGFGTGFADFDSDGWLDLYVINGHVYYHVGRSPYRQPAFLFRNLAGGSFADVSDSAGPYFSAPHAGRGAAVGDLDNDGAADLVVVHQNDPVVLLKNRRPSERWLRVKLQGETCDREAIGAKVTFEHDGRSLVRFVRSGAGYLSQSDLRILFPVSAADALEVGVVWPGGRREVFRRLSAGRTNVLAEGTGENP